MDRTADMAYFDECFMKMALREAEKAAIDGEVPLGAPEVIITHNK